MTGGQPFPELPQFTRQIVIGPRRTGDDANDTSAAFAGLLHPFTGVLGIGVSVGTWPSTVLSHLALNWNAENVDSSLTGSGFDEATIIDTLRTVEPSDHKQGAKPWAGDSAPRSENAGSRTEDGEPKMGGGEQRVRDVLRHERSESQTGGGDFLAERDPSAGTISRPITDERPAVPQVTDMVDRPTDGIRSSRPIARLVHQLVPSVSSNWSSGPSVGDDQSPGRLMGKDEPPRQSVDEVELSRSVAHSSDSTPSNRSRPEVLTGGETAADDSSVRNRSERSTGGRATENESSAPGRRTSHQSRTAVRSPSRLPLTVSRDRWLVRPDPQTRTETQARPDGTRTSILGQGGGPDAVGSPTDIVARATTTGRGSPGTVLEEMNLTGGADDDQASPRPGSHMELVAPSRRNPSRQSQRQRDAPGEGHEHLSSRVEPGGPGSSTDGPQLSVRHSRTDADRHAALEDDRRPIEEAGGPDDSRSTASRPSIDPSSRIEERIDIERLADRLARTLERRDRIERERRGR